MAQSEISCSFLPQIANFESLLRRLTRKAPRAAFMLLETFYFTTLPPNGQQPPTPLPFYHTGAVMSTSQFEFASTMPQCIRCSVLGM
jgi:hypothetical protein